MCWARFAGGLGLRARSLCLPACCCSFWSHSAYHPAPRPSPCRFGAAPDTASAAPVEGANPLLGGSGAGGGHGGLHLADVQRRMQEAYQQHKPEDESAAQP